MTPSPRVTWPSPAMTTAPLRRTHRTVVDRIRRFVGMRAILDYNSPRGDSRPRLSSRVKLDSFLPLRSAERCSAGQPRAAVPTWTVRDLHLLLQRNQRYRRNRRDYAHGFPAGEFFFEEEPCQQDR